MAKITPKAIDAVFDDSVLDALPSNDTLKHGVAIAKRTADPSWQSSNQAAIDKKKQRPEYQAKRAKLNKAMALDRSVQDKKSETIKQQYADPAYKEFRTSIIKEVTKTTAWKQAHAAGMSKREANGWAEKNIEAAKKRCKPIVSTEYGVFPGKKHLAEHMTSLGVGNAMGKLDNWLKTKPTELYYISKEEYIMLTGKEL